MRRIVASYGIALVVPILSIRGLLRTIINPLDILMLLMVSIALMKRTTQIPKSSKTINTLVCSGLYMVRSAVPGRLWPFINDPERSKQFGSNLLHGNCPWELHGSSTVAPHLESDLTTLWKSLFQVMENNFAAENSQLQSNLAALKDIKEDYMLNLEMINVMPPKTQQCISDASEI